MSSIEKIPGGNLTPAQPAKTEVYSDISGSDAASIAPRVLPVTDLPITAGKGEKRDRFPKILKTVGLNAKALGLTAGSIAGQEVAAHVGGVIAAAVPNPIDWTHNPALLATEIAASYGFYGVSQWNTNHEAGERADAGRPSYNVLSTGLRNTARKLFPNSKKAQQTGEQAGGFSVPGVMEAWYWGGAANAIGRVTSHQGGVLNLGGVVIIDHRSAAFIFGANTAAAGLNSYQTDASKYLRESGREPRTGIRSLLDVPATVGPVTKIKLVRNVERVQRAATHVKENVIYRNRNK